MIVRTAVSSEVLNRYKEGMFRRVNEWWWNESVDVYRNTFGVDEPHVGEFGSHVYMEITLKATPIKVPEFLLSHRPIRRMVAESRRQLALREGAWEDMTGPRHF
jgi:hypothetical protein